MTEVVVTIIGDDEQGVEVRTGDGGVAYIYHNQEHMLTELYQDRIDPTDEEVDYEKLSEGKKYLEDWKGEDKWNWNMIMDALFWLASPETQWNITVVNNSKP